MECTRCSKVSREKAKDPFGHNFVVSKTTPATCETDGREYSDCTRCGGYTYKVLPKLGHKWEKSALIPATCVKEGTQRYRCERVVNGCTATKTETLPRIDHVMEEIVIKKATCVNDGTILHRCKNCTTMDSYETVPAYKEHNFKLTSMVTYCNQPGVKFYSCVICSYGYSEPVPATGHQWEVTSMLGATCTSPNIVKYKCKNCTETKTETEGEKADHSWRETYYEPATCAADGYKSYKCNACSETKTEILPATDKCTWGAWKVITPASCTTDGLREAECTVCGDKKQETIPSEGAHSYKTTSTKNPTCEAAGSKTFTCSKCGKTKTETLEATGHRWKAEVVTKAATCTQTGKAETECSACGKKETKTLPKLAHNWGAWRVTKEPTTTAEGKEERTCTLCGNKESKAIPKKTSSTPTPRPTATARPTATPRVTAANRNASALQAEAGVVEVFSTSGKVNMRSGPGKNNDRIQQVAKRNTNLGELLDAKADKTGVVWFKVKYKGKTSWITSEHAKAVVGQPDGRIRLYEGEEGDVTELTNFYLKSVSEAVEKLELAVDEYSEEYAVSASGEVIFICGNDYVESIELIGEGYTIFGIKVGDSIRDVQNKLKNANVVRVGNENVYQIICSQDSLHIDEFGFDGKLTIVMNDDGKVESMLLEANVPEA